MKTSNLDQALFSAVLYNQPILRKEIMSLGESLKCTVLIRYAHILCESKSPKSGLCFKNSDGFKDLGLWVMPDNQQEGMLEDWMKSCIKEDESALFQQASQAVQTIANPKFKDHLRSKAEIATWLAWQKQPGHELYGAIGLVKIVHRSLAVRRSKRRKYQTILKQNKAA